MPVTRMNMRASSTRPAARARKASGRGHRVQVRCAADVKTEEKVQEKGPVEKLVELVGGGDAEKPAETPKTEAVAAPEKPADKPAEASAAPAAKATPAPTPPADDDKYFSTVDPRLSKGEVKEVLEQFDTWNKALASGDPEKVADLYAEDGVLLPTVSNSVRSTRAGIVDYFTNFVKLQPQGVINEYAIRLEALDYDGKHQMISNSGIYTFTFGIDGRKVQARYTYTYKRVGDSWKILSHHSSQLPSQLAPTPFKGDKYISESSSDKGLTEQEKAGVLRAFDQWNAALATLDPNIVADCYAGDAVLLPTVADDVRTTREERRSYFEDFCKLKPQGKFDEYHIRLIGRDSLGLPNAVSNQGVYTFTKGTDGSTVQARYTFNYARESGRWMIKKHHSSAMPEEALPKEG